MRAGRAVHLNIIYINPRLNVLKLLIIFLLYVLYLSVSYIIYFLCFAVTVWQLTSRSRSTETCVLSTAQCKSHVFPDAAKLPNAHHFSHCCMWNWIQQRRGLTCWSIAIEAQVFVCFAGSLLWPTVDSALHIFAPSAWIYCAVLTHTWYGSCQVAYNSRGHRRCGSNIVIVLLTKTIVLVDNLATEFASLQMMAKDRIPSLSEDCVRKPLRPTSLCLNPKPPLKRYPWECWISTRTQG